MVTYFHCLSGQKTGSFIRMIFPNKYTVDCAAYLFTSEYLDSLEVLHPSIALQNAFYIDGSSTRKADSGNYSIRDFHIQYQNGIPYYRFWAPIEGTRGIRQGFAIAVDVSSSDLKNKVNEFIITMTGAGL
jgi:hypothetical protein